MSQSLEDQIKENWDKYQCEIFDFAKMLMGSDAEATVRWCYLCSLFEIKATKYPELLNDDANVRSWLYYTMREICLKRQQYLNHKNNLSWKRRIGIGLKNISETITNLRQRLKWPRI